MTWTLSSLGNGVNDDTANFLSIIADAKATGGGEIRVPAPPKAYVVSSTIALPPGVTLTADPGTQINTQAGNYTLFSLTGSHTGVKGFTINNAAKTGGLDVSIDTGPGSMQFIYAQDIVSNDSFGLVGDSGSGQGLYLSTWVQRCTTNRLRGPGFAFTRSYSLLYVEDCVASYPSSASANFTGFSLNNAVLTGVPAVGGSQFRGCFTLGTSTGTEVGSTQCGFAIENTAAVWIDACDADTCARFGWLFSNVNSLHMVAPSASVCNDFGMWLINCAGVDMTAPQILGRAGYPGGAGAHGLVLQGCDDIAICNPAISDATGHGIYIPDQIGRINITGGKSRGNTGVGIVTQTTGAVLVTGMQFAYNGGNYNLGGAQHYLQSCQLSNGQVVNVSGPVSG